MELFLEDLDKTSKIRIIKNENCLKMIVIEICSEQEIELDIDIEELILLTEKLKE